MPEIILNNSEIYCKLFYSVNQSISNNTSTITVALKDMQLKSGGSIGGLGTVFVYPGGVIRVNDETVCTALLTDTQGISVSLTNNEYRTVSIAGPGSWSNEQTSSEINHNDDGTASVKFTVSIRLGFMHSGGTLNEFSSMNVSQTVSLPTIGRASSITSLSNATLGQSCSVKWIPMASSFRYKLKFSIGDWSYTTNSIYPNQTTEYTYTGTLSMDAAYQIPNSTTGTMTVTLMTYFDPECTQQIGSDSSRTFTVEVQSSAIPIMGGQTATIVNSNPTVNGWGVAISNMTKIKLSGTASGVFGSTIKSYIITGGYTTTTSAWPYTGSVLNKTGNVTFTIQVVDSRGRKSAPVTTDAVYFYPYTAPSINSFSVSRDAADATIANASTNFSFSSIKVNNVEKNSVIAQLSYKLSSSSSWSNVSIMNNEIKMISISDINSYDFKLTVTDTLGNTATSERYISTMEAVMSFGSDGKGLGIGKIAESENLEIGLKTIFFDDLYLRIGNESVPLKDYIVGIMNGTYS